LQELKRIKDEDYNWDLTTVWIGLSKDGIGEITNIFFMTTSTLFRV
jgi:hypothetical protein